MKIDFTGVETLDTSPIPAGIYLATVRKAEHKVASTGNPMITWSFSVAEGEHEGRVVFCNTVLVPQALWRLKLILRGFLTEEELEGEFDFEPADYQDEMCYITVTQRPGQNGGTQNDVQNTLPLNYQDEEEGDDFS